MVMAIQNPVTEKRQSGAAGKAVPAGFKLTEVGVIPEDWECKYLGEFGDIVRGGSPRPAGDPRYFEGDFIPWLTVASLTAIPDAQQVVITTSSMLTELGSKHSRTLEKDTLIISNSGATLGVAKILGIKCCANDGVAAIINQRVGNKSFLVHYINTITKNLHDKVATGNGQPNLNTDLIRLIPVPFPKEKEQEKIAGTLSDCDNFILKLEKLIAKKQAIKTATMQQLLTGKTRLPQFALWDDRTAKGYKKSELGEIPEDWSIENFSTLATLRNERFNHRTKDIECFFAK
ncbi:restriction endonuclease subunit S [Dickeya oryzae]|uniref:Restriction endonuclease subunit S n=1 Tax=Dickeya oryzae TaxID=1240404 RepID=A0AB39IIU7_9GAMM|nr:restriction endonuclease subunit S [Dickeya oryzae]